MIMKNLRPRNPGPKVEREKEKTRGRNLSRGGAHPARPLSVMMMTTMTMMTTTMRTMMANLIRIVSNKVMMMIQTPMITPIRPGFSVKRCVSCSRQETPNKQLELTKQEISKVGSSELMSGRKEKNGVQT
nr:uncharacterized protein LOC129271988 [Lytechinus pictus]